MLLKELQIQLAVESLKKGGVVSIPTDTLYGLCCLISKNFSIDRIYAIKSRLRNNPIAICVSDVSEIYKYTDCTLPEISLRKLLPGKATLVFKRSDVLNSHLNSDTDLIGVRVIDSPVINTIITLCNEPLVLTSCNISGDKSPLCVQGLFPIIAARILDRLL
ncbi:hypothetical protein MXB_2602 [Myxobolus squamalis]|nr:hypothetical protein MXB_2602 [Myxobolus squamalis]